MTPQSNSWSSPPVGPGRSRRCAPLAADEHARPATPTRSTPWSRSANSTGCMSRASSSRGRDHWPTSAVYGLPALELPPQLAFLGDCDGPADSPARGLGRRARAGLRGVFAHARASPADRRPAGVDGAAVGPARDPYVNWVGRTVIQVREEAALAADAAHHALAARPKLGRRAAGGSARRAGRRGGRDRAELRRRRRYPTRSRPGSARGCRAGSGRRVRFSGTARPPAACQPAPSSTTTACAPGATWRPISARCRPVVAASA